MISPSEFAKLSIPGQHYVLLMALRWALFVLLCGVYKDSDIRCGYMDNFDGGVDAAAREVRRRVL